MIAPAVHEIADTVGALLAIPFLVGVIQLVRYAGKIEHQIKEGALVFKGHTERFNAHTEQVNHMLDDHETRMRIAEGKVTVMWPDYERRSKRSGDPHHFDRDI